MNFKQTVEKDKHRIKDSKIFVVDLLLPLIRKPFHPVDVDDGIDHTQIHIKRLKANKHLRPRRKP